MSPRLARRLLLITSTMAVGYGLGTAERTWGAAPVLILTLIASTSWLAGWVWAWAEHADTIDRLTIERDQAVAGRLIAIAGGNVHTVPLTDPVDELRRAKAAHPAGRDLPRQRR